MQFIQMWILPARRGIEPSVEQKQWNEANRTNRLLRIVKPEGSSGEGIPVHQDAAIYVSRLDAGASVSHAFWEGRLGYFYLLSGKATVNGEHLMTGDAAKVLGPGAFTVEATNVSELLLVDTPE
jgi:redox-sensitive bicupin YhaK (pirin superfamily)